IGFNIILLFLIFFFSSRRRHTSFSRDWSSDVCSSDLKQRGQHFGVASVAGVRALVAAPALDDRAGRVQAVQAQVGAAPVDRDHAGRNLGSGAPLPAGSASANTPPAAGIAARVVASRSSRAVVT